MDGAWEIPHPGAKTPTPTAIHAHCLLLYFSASRNVAHLCAPPSRRFLKLPFYNQPLISLRSFSCLLPRQTKGEKTGSNARQDGICNRKCGAAPFRRAHEGSSKKPTNTGCGELHNRACQGIKILPMPTAFHAHYLLLYLVQPVSSRHLKSVVRVLSVTV